MGKSLFVLLAMVIWDIKRIKSTIFCIGTRGQLLTCMETCDFDLGLIPCLIPGTLIYSWILRFCTSFRESAVFCKPSLQRNCMFLLKFPPLAFWSFPEDCKLGKQKNCQWALNLDKWNPYIQTAQLFHTSLHRSYSKPSPFCMEFLWFFHKRLPLLTMVEYSLNLELDLGKSLWASESSVDLKLWALLNYDVLWCENIWAHLYTLIHFM